jgi:3-methyladenine DNA glycosylase/8-oxoguanine DNA glycosylase
MKITLKAKPPFSFESTVRSHGWVQLAPFKYDKERGELEYILRLKSGKLLHLSMRGMDEGISAEAQAGLRKEEKEELETLLRWMFAMELDLSPFYECARNEPKLAQVEEKAYGRILRSATLFEDIVKTILTTNTVWRSTVRMNRLLVEQYGEPIPGDSQRRAFPTPERLVEIGPETLRSSTGMGYRAPYVWELALKVASGDLDLESLKNSVLPTPELRKELMKIKGVGSYAAGNLLMLLGRYDFIPVDSWALKLVSHEWHSGKPVKPRDVEAAFAGWGEFKGLAYWFWDWSYKGN